MQSRTSILRLLAQSVGGSPSLGARGFGCWTVLVAEIVGPFLLDHFRLAVGTEANPVKEQAERMALCFSPGCPHQGLGEAGGAPVPGEQLPQERPALQGFGAYFLEGRILHTPGHWLPCCLPPRRDLGRLRPLGTPQGSQIPSCRRPREWLDRLGKGAAPPSGRAFHNLVGLTPVCFAGSGHPHMRFLHAPLRSFATRAIMMYTGSSGEVRWRGRYSFQCTWSARALHASKQSVGLQNYVCLVVVCHAALLDQPSS